MPTFEIARLASAPGPQIASRPGWETLGVEYRVTHDFGLAAVEFRGAFRVPA